MAESGFFGALGRGFAPEGEQDTAMRQALLQFGAGMLSNPTGNFSRNVGQALSPAMDRYGVARQAQLDLADRQQKAAQARQKTLLEAHQTRLGLLDQEIAQIELQGQTPPPELMGKYKSAQAELMKALGFGDPPGVGPAQQAPAPVIGGASVGAVPGQAGAPLNPPGGQPPPGGPSGFGPVSLRGPGVPPNPQLAQNGPPAAPQGQGGTPMPPAAQNAPGGPAGLPPGALTPTQLARMAASRRIDPARMSAVLNAQKRFDPTYAAPGSVKRSWDGTETVLPKIGENQEMTPDGGVRNRAGAVQALSEAEAAKAEATQRATARYRPVESVNRDGSKTTALGKQIPGLGLGGGGAPGQAGQVARAQRGQALSGPGDPAAVGVTTQLPAETRAATEALDAVNRNFAEKLRPALADEMGPLGDQLRNLDTQRRLLEEEGLTTGWGQETINKALAPIARVLGINMIGKHITLTEAFTAMVSEQQNQRLMVAKGTQSESDAQRALNELAQLGNTPEANKLVTRYLMAGLQRTMTYNRLMLEASKLDWEAGRRFDADLEGAKARAALPSIWDMPIMQGITLSGQPEGGK